MLSASYISRVSVGSAEVPPLSHLYAFCSSCFMISEGRSFFSLTLASRVKRDSATREMFHWGIKSIFPRNPLLKLDNSSACGQFCLQEMLGNRLDLNMEHIATSNINKNSQRKVGRKYGWLLCRHIRQPVTELEVLGCKSFISSLSPSQFGNSNSSWFGSVWNSQV